MTGHTDKSRRLKEKLKNDEKLFLSLVDQMLDTVAIIDWDGTILFTNPAGAKQIGMESPEDCIGVNVLGFVHPDFMASVIRDLELIREGKRGSSFTDFRIYKIKTKKGEEKWVEGIGKKIEFKGSPVDLITIRDVTERVRMEEELTHYRDHLEDLVKKRTAELRKTNKRLREKIAERKQAEDKQRESEERYRTLMEEAPIGFCVVDTLGNIKYINKKCEEVSGYSRDELIGLNGFTAHLFPEESIQLLAERLAFRIGGGIPRPNEIEVPFICKDGTQIWIEINTTVLKKDGVPTGAQLAILDITERKRVQRVLEESEEKYRTLAATADSMYLVDRECRYLFMNEMHLSRLGVSLDEITGRSYDEFHSEEDTKEFTRNVAEVFDTGRSIQREHKSERDGRHFLRTFSPVKDTEGRVTTITVVSKDITERKRIEEELQKSHERLNYLLSATTAVIYAVKTSGDYDATFVSNNVRQMTGYEPEEFTADPSFWFNHVHPEDQPRVDTEVAKIFEKETHVYEYRFQRKDGTYIWVRDEMKLIRDNEGNPWEIVGFWSNITDWKRLNEELDLERLRLREYFENMPLMAYHITFDGTIFDCNIEVLKTLGYDRKEDLIGKSLIETVYAPASREKARILLEKWKVEKRIKDEGLQVITKEGEIRDVLLNVDTIFDDKGMPLYSLTTHTDVTERKRIHQALRESERFFSGTLNDMLTFVAVLKPNGDIIFVNNTPLNIAGMRLEDIVGKKFYDTYWWEYSEESKQQIREDIASAKSGHTLSHPIQVKTTEGLIWIDFSIHPIFDDEGKVKYIVPEGRDITERRKTEDALRKSEEQYRSLVESTADSIYVIDRNLRYLFANNAYLLRIGLTLDKILNRSYDDIHPRMYDLFPEHVDFVFETGQSTSYEYKSFMDRRSFLRTLSPIKDERGKTVAVTVISKDITDIKKTEAELRSSHEQLRALTGRIQDAREEERTNIAREIHDEIGGALSSLKIDISLLENELLNKADATEMSSLLERTHSTLELIDKTAAAMREIIMRLRPGILDDLGLIAAVEWQLSDFSRRTGIQCTFPSNMGERIFNREISTAMFRIFQECLTNVARHAHAERVTVELNEVAGSLVLKVRDDGVGIPEEKVLGTKSLGLLGIKERAELFGGNVHFTGIRGKGTTVTVTIPLNKL